jgi:hypothetical protein
MTHNIQTVHLVFKTHLDVGFTDFARVVVKSYFEDYIPAAIQLAKRLHEKDGDHGERFVWTTGSWLIYEYLERATKQQKKLLEDAILAGDIVWHGLPFTTHTELMDVSLFKHGLSLSQKLDKRFGRKTIAGKMTDVPGHTRGIVPLLAEAGIQFLHLGANQASTPPNVPDVFRWQMGESDVMVMYQKGGYGDLMTIPGLGDALAFAHTNDNIGPQTFEGVVHSYTDMRKRFPQAELVASTMDAFAAKLATVKDSLPLITGEMGDTWIQGVGSDPTKVNQYRELARLRKAWLDAGTVKADNEAFVKFSNSLMMVPEHTWGMDEKVHLNDYTHYDAASFQAARKEPQFQKFESSWAEQREYLTEAVEHLKGTPLHQEAVDRLEAIKPVKPSVPLNPHPPTPSPSGRGEIKSQKAGVFDTAHFSVGFDEKTGAIVRLKDKATGRNWASDKYKLGLFTYETFSDADYQRYWRQYIINKRPTRVWSLPDNTKIGIAEAAPIHRTWTPGQTAIYQDGDKRFVLVMKLDDEASAQFGCPRVVTAEIEFQEDKAEIRYTLQWFEKPACRLPEAAWLSFNPRVEKPQNWQMDKLGQWISPLEVIRNGNRKLHAVESGIRCVDDSTRITIDTLDAALVAPGEPSLLNFNNRQPVLRNGMHFNLHNNVWATNFRMWYEDDARFRFILKLGGVR